MNSVDEQSSGGSGGVALLIDWESLQPVRLAGQDCLEDIHALLGFARGLGFLRVARAYADWTRIEHASAAPVLFAAGVEPVYVPCGDSAGEAPRPWLAVRLASDAVGLAYQRVPSGVVMVVTGNNALLAALTALHAAGVRVVVIVDRRTAGAYTQAGAVVYEYEEVMGQARPEPAPAGAPAVSDGPPDDSSAAALSAPATPEGPGDRLAPPGAYPLVPEQEPARLWAFDGRGQPAADPLLARLRDLAYEGRPPDSAVLTEIALRGEVESLRAAIDRAEHDWVDLQPEYQRALLGIYAARVKYTQAQPAAVAGPELTERLDGLMRALTRFSGKYRPGAVNGLARDHQPRHSSWLEDARRWHTQLRRDAGLEADAETEHSEALNALDRLVRQWMEASPEESDARLSAVAAQVRVCYAVGIAKSDPELARYVLPVYRDLKAKEFKTLRETAKALQAEQAARARLAGAGDAVEPTRSTLAVCDDAECRMLAAELFMVPEDGIVAVEPAACEVCEGSRDQRALLAMAACLAGAGIQRMLVVGGDPEKRHRIEQTLKDRDIQTVCVDGDDHSSDRKAIQRMQWAQLVVVWAPTLSHKVSNNYTDHVPANALGVTVTRTGIESLCRDVITKLGY